MGITEFLKKRQTIIKIFVSVGLLIYLSTIIDWKLFASSILGANLKYAILVVLFIPVTMFFRLYRFQLIINERVGEKKRISIYDSLKIYCVGYGLNMIMPGSSGDIARSYYAYKKHKIKEEMLSASILDLIFGLFSLFIFGVYYSMKLGYDTYSIISAVVVLVSGWFIFFPKHLPWSWLSVIAGKIFKIKLETKNMINGVVISRRLKMWAIFLSLISWYLTFIQFHFITQMYRLGVSFSFAAGIFPLILLSRLIPVSVNGLGTQEAATSALFSLAGIAPAYAVLVSLTLTVVFIVIPGIFGLYWAFKTKY